MNLDGSHSGLALLKTPMDLAGNPVFAGVISENNAGHASISAIKITE